MSSVTSKCEPSSRNAESSHLENERCAANMLHLVFFFFNSFGKTKIFLNLSDTVADNKCLLSNVNSFLFFSLKYCLIPQISKY